MDSATFREIQRLFRKNVTVVVSPGFGKIFSDYQHATMLERSTYVENLALVKFFGLPLKGAFVECGTWRGGMAAGMMRLGGPDRDYHFFDSYEGLPPPDPSLDGTDAVTYASELKTHNNCSASLEEFTSVISTAGPMDRVHIHKGWFSDTVPHYDGGPIAVLRLDGDWYESTLVCLRHLFPHVVEGGLVIFDDYYAYTGCSRAVHQYLAETGSASRIDCTAAAAVAYMLKLAPE